MQNPRSSGSKNEQSIGVQATNIENSDSENEDIPLKVSAMRELRHSAKPIRQNDTTLNTTVIFNEESDEEDYHSHFLRKFFSTLQA